MSLPARDSPQDSHPSRVQAPSRNNGSAISEFTACESREYRSDSQLVQACLDGDQKAWKELVTRYGRLVYSIPMRYGLSADDADDVFQDVFTIAFRRLRALRDQTRLSAWLITIAHRESLRLRKLQPTATELEDADDEHGAVPPDQIQAWEQQHLVHQALDQLGSPCRDLLKALFIETGDSTYEEIAARLGIPRGGIGPTRTRCFKKLEAILIALGIETG
jgi:RNA polymerase sigma factor (sigma-70 family)